ncbi:MAG: flagellar hook protein FlgE [Proteobacteria bacterium]|nr:MAG: flagellar hook protein FlgE [Pseudomonadota bacterium]
MPFRVAISGMRAAQTDLNVIGNNIANVNTTGFKSSRAEFQDVFAVSATGASGNPGQGVNTARISQQFTQGNITFTDNGLDLAISGQGFFILDDNGARVYARDGAFGIDRDGFVVNANGHTLNAFTADSTGNITGALARLQISTANTSPSATTEIVLGANFDSQATLPLTTPFDPSDTASFNSTTATSVFDSLGGSHLAQIYFVKTAATNTWEAHTVVDGVVRSGPDTLIFNTSGALITPAGGTITVPAFTASPGTDPINMTIDLSASTQFGAPFGVNQLTQDGYTTGRLAGLDIDSEGIVFARFTNGQSTVQGQIALGNFANPQGLQSLGDNNWAESFAAGNVLEGAPGTGSLGLVQSGALEESNVDLSEQLVALIIAQRNFQANTEVISAADTVTQAVINIR